MIIKLLESTPESYKDDLQQRPITAVIVPPFVSIFFKVK
jgi:hypothetical protein